MGIQSVVLNFIGLCEF